MTVAAAGNIERAMTAGVELARRAEVITGVPTMFLRSLTGPYGSVGWLAGCDSVTAMETAERALAAERSWLRLIDSTAECFVEDPTVTHTTIHRRLA